MPGYFNSDRLRCTGAPVVCANVLQWAPSRVTRRGALAATAAAAAAFPLSPRHLPSPRLPIYTCPPPPPPWKFTIALVPRAPWHADIPTMRPHGRVAGSLLLHKIHLRCSVYFQTATDDTSSYRPFSPFVLFLSFSLCKFADFVTLPFSFARL